MDGIDASLLNTDGNFTLREIDSYQFSYSDNIKILLKSAERAISKSYGDMVKARAVYFEELENYLVEDLLLTRESVPQKLELLKNYLDKITQSENELCLDNIILLSTLLHANVVKALLQKSNYAASDIDVIGYHGQTMYHNPIKRISIQVGDGNLLAKLTKIKVVDNFRERDLNLGGQGAPFAPIYHRALAVRDEKLPLVVVNCGGIANITIVNSHDFSELQGFDTGPGNGLIDSFIKMRTKSIESMDFNGKYGLQGEVCQETIEALFAKSSLVNGENFYNKIPPKSLDIRDLKLIPELDNLSINDGAATLESFSAAAIVSSISKLPNVPDFWVLAGGGFNNPVILQQLKTKLYNFYAREIKIVKASSLGWNSKSLEAQLFAYLAVRSLQDLPLSFPSTTGVAYPVSGGSLHMS